MPGTSTTRSPSPSLAVTRASVHGVKPVTHALSHHAATTSTAPVSLAPTNYGINWVHEVGALLVVFGVLWLVARYIKKRNGLGGAIAGGRGPGGQITVLSRQVLAKGISLAIVRVGTRDLLVGVTPSGVNLISELSAGSAVADPESEFDLDPQAASVEGGAEGTIRPVLTGQLGDQWTVARMGGASPLQAWMAKLDGLREMTVRRS